MDKILEYTLKEDDLSQTANGLVNLVLKNCVRVTGHEISGAKYTKDGIMVDGQRVRVTERMRPGQTLRVRLKDFDDPEKILPLAGGVEVLYEDEDLIIVNKPAGVAVHPSPGHYRDTLANLVAGYFAARGEQTACRIAGRLDMETSGAIVFAKNGATAGRLSRERLQGISGRLYLALVHGTFEESEEANEDGSALPEGSEVSLASESSTFLEDKRMLTMTEVYDLPGETSKLQDILSLSESDLNWHTVDAPIGRVPGVLLKRRVTFEGDDQDAVTHYAVLRQNKEANISLICARIDTGRTHQIRVHMDHIGHTLIGDQIYGHMIAENLLGRHHSDENNPSGEPTSEIILCGGREFPAARAMLHAARIEMIHPFTTEMLSVAAPLPQDFSNLLNALF